MLVWTCVSLTLSLHFPSTRSHVHISPFSDELTRKLLSWIMEARDKHKTGAVWPTSRQRGVIFKVSGFTFLQNTTKNDCLHFATTSELTAFGEGDFHHTTNKSGHRSIQSPKSSGHETRKHWIHNASVRMVPKAPPEPLDSCWPFLKDGISLLFPIKNSLFSHFLPLRCAFSHSNNHPIRIQGVITERMEKLINFTSSQYIRHKTTIAPYAEWSIDFNAISV